MGPPGTNLLLPSWGITRPWSRWNVEDSIVDVGSILCSFCAPLHNYQIHLRRNIFCIHLLVVALLIAICWPCPRCHSFCFVSSYLRSWEASMTILILLGWLRETMKRQSTWLMFLAVMYIGSMVGLKHKLQVCTGQWTIKSTMIWSY